MECYWRNENWFWKASQNFKRTKKWSWIVGLAFEKEKSNLCWSLELTALNDIVEIRRISRINSTSAHWKRQFTTFKRRLFRFWGLYGTSKRVEHRDWIKIKTNWAVENWKIKTCCWFGNGKGDWNDWCYRWQKRNSIIEIIKIITYR